MSQILNLKERYQAFLQYLILFLVTTSLVIASIYFNYRMPTKVNQVLKTEIQMHRNLDWQQRQLIAQVEEITQLIDSLGRSQSNTGYISNVIDQKLNYLSTLNLSDSSINAKLSRILEKTFLEYKAKLLELKDKQADNIEVNRELIRYKDRSDQLQTELDRFNRRAGG